MDPFTNEKIDNLQTPVVNFSKRKGLSLYSFVSGH